MTKRSPSRNPRSKCIKLKHVLQICLLLGVCFWLVYQVKHSHDKKKELDEQDANVSIRDQVDDNVLELGRKDLHPRMQELTRNEKHEEDEEEEMGIEEEVNTKDVNKEEENKHGHEHEEAGKYEELEGEEGTKHEEGEEGTKHEEGEEGTQHEEGEEGTQHEEEEGEENNHQEEEREGNKHEEEEREGNKHEEEDQEEETKSEESVDDGRGGGDDEIDEHDQVKMQGEADHEEDFIDEEKEREEEGEEKEMESNEGEVTLDHETSLEDQDHDDSGWNTHEAREEHYKADDASSEVAHDTQNINSELEKVVSENSNENSAMNDLEQGNSSSNNYTKETNRDQTNSILQLGRSEMTEGGYALNVTTGEKKDDDILSKSKDRSPIKTDNEPVQSNTSTEVSLEADNKSIGGSTEISYPSQHGVLVIMPDSTQAQNDTVDGETTGEASNLQTTELGQVDDGTNADNRHSDPNSTIHRKTENVDPIGQETLNSTSMSESDATGKSIKPEAQGSSTTKETRNTAHNENWDRNNESGGTDGSSSTNGTGYEVIQDPIDVNDLQLAKTRKRLAWILVR